MSAPELPSDLIALLLSGVPAIERAEAAVGAADKPAEPDPPQPLPVAGGMVVSAAELPTVLDIPAGPSGLALPELAGLGSPIVHGGGASFSSLDAGSIASAPGPLLEPTEGLATVMAHGTGSGFGRFGREPVGIDVARTASRGLSRPADSRDEAAGIGSGPKKASVSAPVNEAPVAVADGATTDEDTALNIAVLANDGDPDGDPLTVASVTQGANGAVVINLDGTVTYTPNADFNGSDSFTYTVSDGRGGSATATVTVTVNPVNDPPVAEDDAVLTAVDTAAVIAVLANDGDVDGDTLTVASVTQGASGAVAINPDGTVTYTPNAAFTGADSFTYTIGDGQGGSDTATVEVYVGSAIEGGAGDDVLNGTNGDDVIFGHGGNDTLKGRNGDDRLYAGDGDDTLNGQGGSDALFGGAGDDILVWNSLDATIDGGSGSDTLRVETGDANLTIFTGTIRGIETVDLATDTGSNTLTLTAQDVLDMSDGGTVTVLGDGADSVDAGTGWTDAGFDAAGNHVFTQMVAGVLTTLSVDPEISTNPDITA